MAPISDDSFSPASLIKQLAAMLYDSMLIFALLFSVSTLAIISNQGEAIESNPWFTFCLILTLFTFYAWFWNKSGQTLGMQVWKIRIVSESGSNPDWSVCYLRLISALLSILCFGLGYWWRLFRPYTWHDRLSKTRIINVPATSKK